MKVQRTKLKQVKPHDLMNREVLLVGTLDTKGRELQFVKRELKKGDIDTLVMDAGTLGRPFFRPDISREEVAEAGGGDLENLKSTGDRGKAVETMMKGVAILTRRMYSEGRIAGIMGMGGSAGTALASSAMQVVPIGVPKLIVSTAASGDTSRFVREKDISMMYSVTDISGLNRISRRVFANAAAAMAGMIKSRQAEEEVPEKPLISATMMGVTTDCVTKAREELEKSGYEVVVFHARGSGGRAMESVIQEGLVKGVLDVTTVEIVNRLVGGVCDAGPTRLEAAGEKGIPQAVSCGGLDFVNFWVDSVPTKFKKRKLYQHNPMIILMRTTEEENRRAGQVIAEKLNRARGRVAFFIPLQGFSSVDAEGKVFYDPGADKAFVQSLEKHLFSPKVEVVKCNNHINDPEFASRMADFLKERVPVGKARHTSKNMKFTR